MANLRILIFFSCLIIVFLFPASSFSQQTHSGPGKTVIPKKPIALVEDSEDIAITDPITYDVAPDAPLTINTERSKPNQRRIQITDSIKAKSTETKSAQTQYLELTSIDPFYQKKD